MSARLVEVIEVQIVRGDGKETPIRGVTQYYSKDGSLLAERDCSLDMAIDDLAKGLEPNAPLSVEAALNFRRLVKERVR